MAAPNSAKRWLTVLLPEPIPPESPMTRDMWRGYAEPPGRAQAGTCSGSPFFRRAGNDGVVAPIGGPIERGVGRAEEAFCVRPARHRWKPREKSGRRGSWMWKGLGATRRRGVLCGRPAPSGSGQGECMPIGSAPDRVRASVSTEALRSPGWGPKNLVNTASCGLRCGYVMKCPRPGCAPVGTKAITPCVRC